MWVLWVVSAGAQGLSWSARTSVVEGAGVPSITIRSPMSGTLSLGLQCGGLPVQFEGPIVAGGEVTIPFSGLVSGTSHCSGRVTIDGGNGDFAVMPLDLTVSILGQLGFEVRPDDVDVAGHVARLHPNRGLAELSVHLVGPGGAALGSADIDLSDPATPSIRWTTDAEVVRIDVLARDDAGFKAELQLSPWSYVIPHEDVVFASGASEITAEEAGKLQRTWADLQRVVALYGAVIKVQLFVAGYTDTVGDAGGNQGLSERRARSIASWFRAQGLKIPVWYQGYGERVLAVPTGDGADEAANRRAVYVLAAEAPTGVRDLPDGTWKQL